MARLQHEGEEGDFRENIASEVEDEESSPASFDIVTYPADFTLEVLYGKIVRKEIVIPGFQRKYVWKLKQASRLIESFLLGIPVPPIFLFARADGKHLVVDGQQRLKSIAYFFSGFFGESEKGVREEFSLSLDEKSPYKDQTFKDLESYNEPAFRRLNNAVLRSFVIKQLKPKGDTSVYHVFERLNTGGTLLVGQEIRNCIYHGPFNELLRELNNPVSKKSRLPEASQSTIRKWREILGKPKADLRQRDIELILRFFALQDGLAGYEKPMKDFLSKYMDEKKNSDRHWIAERGQLFRDTVDAVRSRLGPKPFHIHTGLNAAVFDSVFVAFAENLDRIPADIGKRFQRLKRDKTYLKCVTSGTTDEAIVPKRLSRAKKILFGNQSLRTTARKRSK